MSDAPDRDRVRWGILGTGWAASMFATTLAKVRAAELVSVASRDLKRAEAFSASYRIPRAYGDYESLASSGELDAVYIGTPVFAHHQHAVLCLARKKAVLCEKPVAMTAAEASAIAETAQREGVFCMEAMWTRFLPAITRARELVRAGEVGQPRLIRADLGFRQRQGSNNRLLLPHYGGPFLDLGVYPISIIYFFFGAPEEVKAVVWRGASQVDDTVVATLGYPEMIAEVVTSASTTLSNRLTIYGTGGRLTLDPPLYHPESILLEYCSESAPERSYSRGFLHRMADRVPILHRARLALRRGGVVASRRLTLPTVGDPTRFEIEAANECIRRGETQSPIMPLTDSVAVMKIMDQIRERADSPG